MSNQVIVSIFMLVLVMTIALYLGSKNYNGFTFSKSQLREYPYEGFTGYQEAFELREGIDSKRPGIKPAINTSKPTDANKPASTTAPAPQSSSIGSGPDKSLFSSSPSSLNEPTVFNVQDKPKVTVEMPKVTIEMPGTDAKEGFETSSEQKVAGFKGLYGSPYEGQKPIGFMYNNKGSTTCKNYGYTNSQGFVCMSENDIKLLTTRGGNAVGVSDQIGK